MDKNLLITIGRQFGSGGKQIATCLSQMLDIPVYDNELLMEAARSSGLSEELFRRSDEKKSCSASRARSSSRKPRREVLCLWAGRRTMCCESSVR